MSRSKQMLGFSLGGVLLVCVGACSTLDAKKPSELTPSTPCETAEDCPGPQEACRYRECIEGLCRITQLPENTGLPSQKEGDCVRVVCSSEGSTAKVFDAKDVPESADPCLSYTCDEQTEEPVVVNTASGVECAESLQCDGQGSCVTCVEDDDCQSDCQTAVCKCEDGGCVSATCTNGTKDGTETHLDCGGMLCNPCADTFNCIENSDCISKVCGKDKTCTPAACNDQVENGLETDLDCGGTECDPCADGERCLAIDGSDCQSKVCKAGVCQVPTCTDGETNGTESDVDCGGSKDACPRCGDGKRCQETSDCIPTHNCIKNVCKKPDISKGS